MSSGRERSDELPDVEKISDSRENSTLLLSEEQALAKARSKPNDALPILITYGLNDPDNPRNWPKWRKWYITIVVSMLNVFTYVVHYLWVRLELTKGIQNMVCRRYIVGSNWNSRRVRRLS
jgi:hypothetical protein